MSEEERNVNAQEPEETPEVPSVGEAQELEVAAGGETQPTEPSEEAQSTPAGDEASQPEETEPAAEVESAAEAAEEPTTAPPEEEVKPEAPSPPSPTVPANGDEEITDDDRLMAALTWLGLVILQVPLISLVLLLSETNKNRPFQRFHAINSILFWVVGFFYEIIAVIVYLVLTLITFGCLGFFLWVIFFLPHILALYYAYQAYQGQHSEIPFLTELARNQGWI